MIFEILIFSKSRLRDDVKFSVHHCLRIGMLIPPSSVCLLFTYRDAYSAEFGLFMVHSIEVGAVSLCLNQSRSHRSPRPGRRMRLEKWITVKKLIVTLWEILLSGTYTLRYIYSPSWHCCVLQINDKWLFEYP